MFIIKNVSRETLSQLNSVLSNRDSVSSFVKFLSVFDLVAVD